MEYTRSIGDYYETFEGTPKEIAELIAVLEVKKKSGAKINMPDLTKDLTKAVDKAVEMVNIKANRIAKGGILKGGE